MPNQPTIHSLTLGMAQAYLIESSEGLVLLDAGSPGHEQKVVKEMEILGRSDLRLIFITHAHLDHYGSATALRRLTGAPIAIHGADAEAMANGETQLGTARGRGKLLPPIFSLVQRFIDIEPTSPDIMMSDGDSTENYGLNGRLLHTPGHTAGSSSLIVGEEIAFVGDLITNRDRPRLQRLYAQDWSGLAESLNRLKKLDPGLIYPGHGKKPIRNSELHNLVSP
jgi:glyoxylase-like metal-dependent hydrolase (beta-lactamase superfamily II)